MGNQSYPIGFPEITNQYFQNHHLTIAKLLLIKTRQ